jgi:hypothetical protein
MDNAIFQKLQEAVEWPCRSRDWFALAEQAVNTVYALGEHPEELADRLIKNLTRRAFAPEKPLPSATQASASEKEADENAMDEDMPEGSQAPEGSVAPEGSQAPVGSQAPASSQQPDEAGDAFKLSQLLFVVGHVAIKHIVHLELIEREWKRQKQEKEMGACAFDGLGLSNADAMRMFGTQPTSWRRAATTVRWERRTRTTLTRSRGTRRMRLASGSMPCARQSCCSARTRCSRSTATCSSISAAPRTSTRSVAGVRSNRCDG